MIRKTLLPALIFLIAFQTECFSQVFRFPAIGIRSLESMEITSIETGADRTVISMTLENRINGGYFCADRNIFIILPDGSRLKLTEAKGIPNCPETYRFKAVGEKLEFKLLFPPMKPGTAWLDLIEECSDNCFSIHGILLDNDFTGKINEAVAHTDRGEVNTAIELYRTLIEKTGKDKAGILGSLYSDLITLLNRQGYTSMASEWYKKLVDSNLPAKQLYVNNLNARGIKY
jgi:hypothetical protein